VRPQFPVGVTAVVRVATPQMAFGGRGGGNADSEPSEEVESSFRLFGLDADATYDDIEKKYEELIVTYAKDVKLKIKLGVAKDKILDYQLSKRMANVKMGRSTARFGEDLKPQVKAPLIKLPPFLERVMELPTRALLTKNAAIFGVIGLLPALSKSWASTAVSLGFGLAMWLLYNRGVEAPPSGMEMEMRPPKVRPLLLTAGITALSGMIGATLSMIAYASLLSFLAQELVISLSTSFCWFLSSSLFKVQDDY